MNTGRAGELGLDAGVAACRRVGEGGPGLVRTGIGGYAESRPNPDGRSGGRNDILTRRGK